MNKKIQKIVILILKKIILNLKISKKTLIKNYYKEMKKDNIKKKKIQKLIEFEKYEIL